MLRTVFGIDVAHLEGPPQAFAFYNGDIAWKIFKNNFWRYNLPGARYNALVSTAELDFDSSFQGYPTCLYLSHMVRWPDGHKWPNMAKMAIYGHRAMCDQ